MRPSWHIARHALSGRRTRTILLVLAVGLASALVAAVSTGMKTVQATVEHRISRAIGNVDARIIHRYGSPFESTIVEEVRSWPGVREAAARTQGALTLARTDDRRDEDGRRIRTTAQARGVDATRQESFAQYDLAEGRMPTDTSEILLDPLTAQRLDVGIGETVRVAVRQTHEMRFNACPRERLDRRPEEHRLVVGVRDHEQHSSPPIWRITSRTPFSCPCSSPEQPPHADIDDGPDEKQRDDDQP